MISINGFYDASVFKYSVFPGEVMTIPAKHQHFIDLAHSKFKDDPRFIALLGAGSMITNNMDEHSDVDLVAVVKDEFLPSVMEERAAILQGLGALLSAFTGEHIGDARVSICLYKNPLLHVDVKFISLSDLKKRVEDPIILFERERAVTKIYETTSPEHPMPDLQWIENRYWTWIHYGSVKLARGEFFEVIDFVSFLRGAVLGPLILTSNGQLPRGVRRIERYAGELEGELKRTAARHDYNSCKEAIAASIGLYRKLRSGYKADLKINSEVENAAVEYFEKL